MDVTPVQPATSSDFVRHPASSSVVEALEMLRSDLIRAERALRVLSQDATELTPMFVARLNVAAHLVHNAASAVSSDGLLRAR